MNQKLKNEDVVVTGQRVLRNINGILLLDKPAGVTSNAALQTVKRLFKVKKAGHTGSLDPLATGMLPICFGEATKFSQFLLNADKRYQVIAKLGVKTTTGDAEGEIVSEKPVTADILAQLQTALQQFRGEITQVPSMYSALKFQGQPLYKLARQGITVERTARAVMIYELNVLSQDETTLTLDVHCSKGTYIRTLVDDLGDVLGCGAHVSFLRRSTVGKYQAERMHTIESLIEMASQNDFSGLDQLLLPLDSMLEDWPGLRLSAKTIFYMRQGQPVLIPRAPMNGWVRLDNQEGQFVGVGEMLPDGKVAPRRLIKLHQTKEIFSHDKQQW